MALKFTILYFWLSFCLNCGRSSSIEELGETRPKKLEINPEVGKSIRINQQIAPSTEGWETPFSGKFIMLDIAIIYQGIIRKLKYGIYFKIFNWLQKASYGYEIKCVILLMWWILMIKVSLCLFVHRGGQENSKWWVFGPKTRFQHLLTNFYHNKHNSLLLFH